MNINNNRIMIHTRIRTENPLFTYRALPSRDDICFHIILKVTLNTFSILETLYRLSKYFQINMNHLNTTEIIFTGCFMNMSQKLKYFSKYKCI